MYGLRCKFHTACTYIRLVNSGTEIGFHRCFISSFLSFSVCQSSFQRTTPLHSLWHGIHTSNWHAETPVGITVGERDLFIGITVRRRNRKVTIKVKSLTIARSTFEQIGDLLSAGGTVQYGVRSGTQWSEVVKLCLRRCSPGRLGREGMGMGWDNRVTVRLHCRSVDRKWMGLGKERKGLIALITDFTFLSEGLIGKC